jgi:hypothetical protein
MAERPVRCCAALLYLPLVLWGGRTGLPACLPARLLQVRRQLTCEERAALLAHEAPAGEGPAVFNDGRIMEVGASGRAWAWAWA